MQESVTNISSPVSPGPAPTPIALPRQVTVGAILFGRYRLARELGRGGCGVVWQAHDMELGLEVALKFLPDLVSRDDEAIDDLKREIRRGLRLTHPGIVRVHNFIRDTNLAAIAMEYVDGTTMRQRKLESPGRALDVEQLQPVIGPLCDVLSYVHDVAKLVHRDIKPGNLMVTSTGDVKVADFGIASSLADSITRMTNTPASGGTLPYMSPQQARGEAPAVTDDIYALGVTIYELLTGKPPFYRGDIAIQASEIVPPLMTVRREEFGVSGKKPIPDEWERAIAMCLAKTREARPSSARALRELLLPGGTVPASNPRTQLTTVHSLPPPLSAPPAIPARPDPGFVLPSSSPTRSRGALAASLALAALVITLLFGWLGWKLADSSAPVANDRAASTITSSTP